MAVATSTNFNNAFNAGYTRQRTLDRDKAVRNAFLQGGGDVESVQSQLIAAGALDEANAYGKMDENRRARTARDRAAGQVDAGDTLGARRTYVQAGMAGEANALGQIDDDGLKRHALLGEKLGAISLNLMSIKDPAERQAVFQRAAPEMLKQGLYDSPEEAAGQDLSDEGLERNIMLSLGLRNELDRRQKAAAAEVARSNTEADNKRLDLQLEETRRHNKAAEDTAGSRAETARINANRPRANGGGRGKGTVGLSLEAAIAEARRRGIM